MPAPNPEILVKKWYFILLGLSILGTGIILEWLFLPHDEMKSLTVETIATTLISVGALILVSIVLLVFGIKYNAIQLSRKR